MCGSYSKRPFFSPPKWRKKALFLKNNSVMNSYDPSLRSFNPFQYPSGWLYFHPAGLAGSSHQKPLEAEIWTMAVVFPSGRELFLVCHNWTNSSKIVKRSSTNNLIDVLFLNNVIDTVGFVKRTKAKNYLLKNTSSTKKMHFWLDLLFWRCLFADAHRWV